MCQSIYAMTSSLCVPTLARLGNSQKYCAEVFERTTQFSCGWDALASAKENIVDSQQPHFLSQHIYVLNYT